MPLEEAAVEARSELLTQEGPTREGRGGSISEAKEAQRRLQEGKREESLEQRTL